MKAGLSIIKRSLVGGIFLRKKICSSRSEREREERRLSLWSTAHIRRIPALTRLTRFGGQAQMNSRLPGGVVAGGGSNSILLSITLIIGNITLDFYGPLLSVLSIFPVSVRFQTVARGGDPCPPSTTSRPQPLAQAA
jgi:hypothetical protein